MRLILKICPILIVTLFLHINVFAQAQGKEFYDEDIIFQNEGLIQFDIYQKLEKENYIKNQAGTEPAQRGYFDENMVNYITSDAPQKKASTKATSFQDMASELEEDNTNTPDQNEGEYRDYFFDFD